MIDEKKLAEYRVQIITDMLAARNLIIKVNLNNATSLDEYGTEVLTDDRNHRIFIVDELQKLKIEGGMLHIQTEEAEIEIKLSEIIFIFNHETGVLLSLSSVDHGFTIQNITTFKPEEKKNIINIIKEHLMDIFYAMDINATSKDSSVIAKLLGNPDIHITTVYIPSA
jgi:hypothetical protein